MAGLLGANFSRCLLDKGYDVVGIDNLSGGYLDFVDPRLSAAEKFHEIDLANGEDVQNIFKKYRPEYVYHFAAYAAEGLSPFMRNFNYTNNLNRRSVKQTNG